MRAVDRLGTTVVKAQQEDPVAGLLQDVNAALAYRYRQTPHARASMRRAVLHVLRALQSGHEVETYAQIAFGFWYKVYFSTPGGVLKSDSNGEHLDTRAFARRVIKSQDLRPVSLSAVMENWTVGGLWESCKPVSALLLRTWLTCAEAYYDQREAQQKRA